MTDSVKIEWVKGLLQNDPQATDDLVSGYLSMAESRILNAMDPLGVLGSECALPEKYDNIQCELAARYFSRRGGLGEISHSENGISRTYESSTDKDLLSFVTPYAKVM